MAGESASLDRSQVKLVALVPYESPSTHEYGMLISSAARGWDAILVWINAKSGFLSFEDKAGKDVFPNMVVPQEIPDETQQAYSQRIFHVCGVKASGKVVLGCALVACNLWILLCTEVNSKPAVQLPGNHCIFGITAAQWVYIPLQIRTADPEADFRQGEMLTEFPISGYHYFCETVDVTRPFPSSHAVSDPSWEFVWNYYLTQPFRRVGLGAVAPHMLQGLAEQRTLPDLLGKLFTVALIARRSRLHAGTRYKARGINSIAAAANEIECEQIITLQSARWASYVWRRGSVPLRWSQAVKPNGVGTAIAIEGDRTFSGSRRYFRRLQMRFQNHFMHASDRDTSGHLTPEQRESSLEFPIAVVNLLRKGSMDRDRSESKLYTAFCDLMTALSKECGMNIINIGLDWHELSATHGGLAPVVQILWGATEENMQSFGFSEGTFQETGERALGDPTPDVSKDETPWGNTMVARRTRRQQGVFRFNCADSLDRTNVASYYSAFQVLLEQCRCLGLQVVAHRSDAAVTGAASGAARDAVARTVARKQSVTNATKMLGSFAARMGSMAQGLVAQPSTSANPSAAPAVATAEAADDAPPPPLPPPTHILAADGTWWERKQVPWPPENPTGKRDVYVNHDSRTTQWNAPPAWGEWELARQPVDRIRALAHSPLLAVYKDLFRVSGDKNAELYTGSAAMHSSQLDLLLSESSSGHGVSGFFNNAHTAVTRRFKNILTDDRTHAIFELILGNDPSASVDCGPSFASRNAAAALAEEAQALPACDDEDSDGDADPLSLIPWPARTPPAAAGGNSAFGAAAPGSAPGGGDSALSQPSSQTASPTREVTARSSSGAMPQQFTPPVSPQMITVPGNVPATDPKDLEELAGPPSDRVPPTPASGRASACGSALNELRGAPSPASASQDNLSSPAQLASDFASLQTTPQGTATIAAPPADLLSLHDDPHAPTASAAPQDPALQFQAPQQLQMPSNPGAADTPAPAADAAAGGALNGPISHSVPVASGTLDEAVNAMDPFPPMVSTAAMGTNGSTAPAVGGVASAPAAASPAPDDAPPSDAGSIARLSSSYIDVGGFDDGKGEFRQVNVSDKGLIDPLGAPSEPQGSLL